jgi:ABC-2 type transport system permease protein
MGKFKAALQNFFIERNSDKAKANRNGFRVLFQKELTDHLESWRFIILFLLLFAVMLASLYGAAGTLAQNAAQSASQNQQQASTPTEFLFLQLFTTAGSSIYSFTTFLAFLGPVFGIMLGFDAINEEQAQGTLNRLASQPIYRDTIINAKFAAGSACIFLTVFALGGLFTGLGLIYTGLTLSGEEVARIVIYLLLASVYICVWLAVAMLFSVLCRHAATAALACIAIWLVLSLFLSLIVTGIAGAIYPLSGPMAQLNALKNYQAQVAMSRISPYYLFSEASSVIMNPNVRSLDLMSLLMESQKGAIASYLTLGQSLLQIWPHLVGMIALVVVIFAAAYISFMRREIRA